MSKIQYTIRNIPLAVDRSLRKQAKQSDTSLNQTVVDTLTKQLFGSTDIPDTDNFDWFVGAGKDTLGAEFDEAIADQSKIDERLWQ